MSKHIKATETMEVYFDLDGMKTNGSTLPADIITTLSRPDLVIIDRASTPTEVLLYELTVPYESAANTQNARTGKNNRYSPLVDDIQASRPSKLVRGAT